MRHGGLFLFSPRPFAGIRGVFGQVICHLDMSSLRQPMAKLQERLSSAAGGRPSAAACCSPIHYHRFSGANRLSLEAKPRFRLTIILCR